MVCSTKVRIITEAFWVSFSQDFTRKALPEVPIGGVIEGLQQDYYGGTRNALPMNTSGAVESTTGAVAQRSVSSRRSSNRTCGFPASGSRTRHHAFAHGRLCVRISNRASPKDW